MGDTITAGKIMRAKHPREQKALSREIDIDLDEWNVKAPDELFPGLVAKFSQNKYLKDFMLATGRRNLVECNPGDKIWSCGLSLKNRRKGDRRFWKGDNKLGALLDRVRDHIKHM